MRILWVSNAPWAPTGYGNQTGLICRYLAAHGHEIAVAANYGLQGTKIDAMGVKVYPSGRDQFSNDIIGAYAEDWKADVVISLYDAWPLKFARLESWRNTPWIAWAPVDHETLPPPVLESLRNASLCVAYSRHGYQAMRAAGLQAVYIPHGVDTSVFTPGDQREARQYLGFPQDAFIAGMVATNNTYPSRKCIPQAILAFERLRRMPGYSDAVLYLHMVDDDSKGGVNARQIAGSLGLEIGRDVLFADPYDYHIGYPTNAMVAIYRAIDVLLNPSMGEGFGIPILEAMACGTPAIATRNSAMTELVKGVGWMVEGDPWWSAQGAWQTTPTVHGIYDCLVRAYNAKGTESAARRSEDCQGRAVGYDFERVVAPVWDRLLREHAPAFANRHKHRWARTGRTTMTDSMIVPCLEKDCTCGLFVGDGREQVVENAFPNDIAGVRMDIEDDPRGGVSKVVMREITNDYHLDEIELQDGDAVIDIGAHVGVVSIYLAKRFPGARVYAYEPVTANYERLLRNIRANGVQNVTPVHSAVSGDGRDLTLCGRMEENSGGASAFVAADDAACEAAPSLTLAQILDGNEIERCALLKIDCEGAEYEILRAAAEDGSLARIDRLVGEFHTTEEQDEVTDGRYDWRSLFDLLRDHIPEGNIQIKLCRIGGWQE